MVCIAACDVSGVDWVPRENRGGSDGGGGGGCWKSLGGGGVVASSSLPMLFCGSHRPFLCIRDVVIFLSLYLRFVFASLRNHYRPIDLTVELNGAA